MPDDPDRYLLISLLLLRNRVLLLLVQVAVPQCTAKDDQTADDRPKLKLLLEFIFGAPFLCSRHNASLPHGTLQGVDEANFQVSENCLLDGLSHCSACCSNDVEHERQQAVA